MPGSPTPHLGLTVPTVGGDVDSWGGELNTDLAIIDNLGIAAVLTTSVSLAPTLTQPVTWVFSTAGISGITVTLPIAGSNTGREMRVVMVDVGPGVITVNSAGGTIMGATSDQLSNQNQVARYGSDGTTWRYV